MYCSLKSREKFAGKMYIFSNICSKFFFILQFIHYRDFFNFKMGVTNTFNPSQFFQNRCKFQNLKIILEMLIGQTHSLFCKAEGQNHRQGYLYSRCYYLCWFISLYFSVKSIIEFPERYTALAPRLQIVTKLRSLWQGKTHP